MTLRIEAYAVVGDLQTAALVGRDGSLHWLCLPRFDSPACCSALLDAPRAGRWLLAPAAGGTATSRSYVQESLVLEQVWEAASGAGAVPRPHASAGTQPDVVRIVEGLRGTVEMTTELVARFDFGRVLLWVRRQEGRWTAVGGPDALWLDTPVPLQGRHHSTVARFTVRAGERVTFVLTWAPSYEQAPEPVDAEQALQDTLVFWSDWLRSCTVGGPYAAAVRRSLVTLKALTYAPTGGIAAAVTTSLPTPGTPTSCRSCTR